VVVDGVDVGRLDSFQTHLTDKQKADLTSMSIMNLFLLTVCSESH